MSDTFYTKDEEELIERNAQIIANWRMSIFQFIYDMWGLSPQPARPEYAIQWAEVQRASGETWQELANSVTAEWFGEKRSEQINKQGEGGKKGVSNSDWGTATKKNYFSDNFEDDLDELNWTWYKFEYGKHITWQQSLILMGLEKASLGDAKRHLSVRSGHGIGKSALCSWVILWFLTCFWESQVPCTAPTSHQMHDVLWKELAKWISKMPDAVQGNYDWTQGYLRMTQAPEVWFARARTSSKENTEAIAGVHADHVLIVVDEASGVPEAVFNTAEGALTSGNVFVILIGNPTRVTGYFYDSHNKNAADWQQFAFNCEHSPIVDREYVRRQATRHGKDSAEYRIRVQGEFPHEDVMDDSGYVQLLPRTKIMVEQKMDDLTRFANRKIMGVDPAGEGKDKAVWVIRDNFRAEVVHELPTTNPKEIAQHTLTLMDRYIVTDGNDIVIDSFGVGSDVGKEIAIASGGKVEVYTVLLGNTPSYEEQYNTTFFRRHLDEIDDNDMDLYLNLRALAFFRARSWLVQGGMLVDKNVENSTFSNELQVIKYKRSLQGNKIQLMPKKEMFKLRIPSPNKADAFALTFLRDMDDTPQTKEERERIMEEEEEMDDQFSLL